MKANKSQSIEYPYTLTTHYITFVLNHHNQQRRAMIADLQQHINNWIFQLYTNTSR